MSPRRMVVKIVTVIIVIGKVTEHLGKIQLFSFGFEIV